MVVRRSSRVVQSLSCGRRLTRPVRAHRTDAQQDLSLNVGQRAVRHVRGFVSVPSASLSRSRPRATTSSLRTRRAEDGGIAPLKFRRSRGFRTRRPGTPHSWRRRRPSHDHRVDDADPHQGLCPACTDLIYKDRRRAIQV